VSVAAADRLESLFFERLYLYFGQYTVACASVSPERFETPTSRSTVSGRENPTNGRIGQESLVYRANMSARANSPTRDLPTDWLSEFFDTFPEGELPDTASLGDLDLFSAQEGLGAAPTLAEKKRKAEGSVEQEPSEGVKTAVRSHVLSEGAKKSKSKREKLRRDALNTRFDELSAVLEPGSALKSDKASVVVAATSQIKRLREEHARLSEMIERVQGEKKRQEELNFALAAEKETLVLEKTQLLHEKLRIEAQLQGFLASMPFASPADGVRPIASAKAADAQTWSVPTPFILPATSNDEDVTLRAPVA
jgi:hypothetical protein